MVICYIDTHDAAGLLISIKENKTASLVVACNYYECLTIFISKLKYLCHSEIKAKCLDNRSWKALRMSCIVDLGAFNHKEEAFTALLLEMFDSLYSCISKHSERLLLYSLIHSLIDTYHLSILVIDIFEFCNERVSCLLEISDKVNTVIPSRKLTHTASAKKINMAVKEIAGDFIRVVSLSAMTVESGRSCVCDITEAHYSYCISLLVEEIAERWDISAVSLA